MTETAFRLLKQPLSTSLRCCTAIFLLVAVLQAGCVYKIDIQQGNQLDAEAVDQVEIGMTQSQVRYILGSPVVNDTFQKDRWDYMYYFKGGRAKTPEQRWLIIEFSDGRVSAIKRDVPVERD